MSNSFYIVLTSDASRDQYPENTAADFTMQLKSQLNLIEDWEVAMMRSIYLWWPRTAIRNFLDNSRKFNFCNRLILKLLRFFFL